MKKKKKSEKQQNKYRILINHLEFNTKYQNQHKHEAEIAAAKNYWKMKMENRKSISKKEDLKRKKKRIVRWKHLQRK